MGARLTCSCTEAYCYGAEERSLRIHAELFELSADGQKWLMVEPRLLYIRVTGRADGGSDVIATTHTGRTVLETVVQRGDKVDKISDCFVFWRDRGGTRTLGVNTLSLRDADELRNQMTSPLPATQMMQHNCMAQITVVGEWNGSRLERTDCPTESTMVSINPLNMVFHYNHGLVNVDLLECFASSSPHQSSVLFLSYAANIYRFDFAGLAEKFINQVLNMSSLLLARSTSHDVAISFLLRQRAKAQEKKALLKFHREGESSLTWQKLHLKEVSLSQRLNALGAQETTPTIESLPAHFASSVRDQLLPDCPLTSLFLIFSNMHAFRMWRKPVDIRANDLRALVSPSDVINTPSVLATPPSTSNDNVIPVALPNGKTTVITHHNQNALELKEKVCTKLSVHPSLFELMRSESGGWRLILSEEYEVEKTQGKLGLTIYAHNEAGVIKAEVRGVASFSPGGAAIGDAVVAVDGTMVDQVASAADVEKLLRDGRVIRLRRNSARRVEGADRQKTVQPPPRGRVVRDGIPPQPPEGSPGAMSRAKTDEKMVRGIEELLRTEKKYVMDLGQMIDRFLSIKTVSEIMESALRLQKVQIAFLESLEEAVGDVGGSDVTSRPQVRDSVLRVCALFVNRCGEFKVYAEYAAAYLRLQREIAGSKELLAALEAANCSGEQHCSYESGMIRPVQRVVQYPLMLRAIQEGCIADSMEARQVETALTKMQSLAEYVNEMQRIHEQFSPHIEGARRNNLAMLREKGLRIDIRDLLIFAHISWTNTERGVATDYVIFVFQSIILLLPAAIRGECKPKWTRLLPINEVQLEDGDSEGAGLRLIHVAFRGADGRLSHGQPDTLYHLSCCQPLLKQQLVKSIRKASSNFSRETRRPLSGSSQSDGGYGSDPAKERKMS